MAGAKIAIRPSTSLALSNAAATTPPLPTIPGPPEIFAKLGGELVSLRVLPRGDACGDKNPDVL